jgi:hypothetical protein
MKPPHCFTRAELVDLFLRVRRSHSLPDIGAAGAQAAQLAAGNARYADTRDQSA